MKCQFFIPWPELKGEILDLSHCLTLASHDPVILLIKTDLEAISKQV